jgi:hypothetical protein
MSNCNDTGNDYSTNPIEMIWNHLLIVIIVLFPQNQKSCLRIKARVEENGQD